ncbi:hypothetical protein [Nitrospirillum pindoramense]|uniref:Uncharacterized protein n=1 Tax=Nitrospirillum amazonense TaxID=28077 RepID=A0A560H4D7_9PROT|nr:hypothetical protein [Nitrospirillum amazonense]TWB41021.1 hypothetical protein FBZ90_10845 [Nitrospirillum amazonense]
MPSSIRRPSHRLYGPVSTLLGGRLHLHLSREGVRLDHRPGAWAADRCLADLPLVATAPEADWTAALGSAALGAALAGKRHSGLPLLVTLGDDQVRLFMVPPPRNAQGMRDIRAAAAMRFQMLYGDDPGAWRLACGGAVDRPFLACAMPAALYDTLEVFAGSHGLRLASVAPRFALAWNAVRRRLDGAWLGVVQGRGAHNGGIITLGCVDGHPPDLAAVHRLALPAGPVDAAWLRGQVLTVALRHGLADPGAVALYDDGARRGPSLSAVIAADGPGPGNGGPLIRWIEPGGWPAAGRVLSHLFGTGALAG